jgi:hypothetical protein
MRQAKRVGARLFLAVVFVAHAGCSKGSPTSAQVELVGTLTFTRMGQENSLGKIWTEEGSADLSVKAELSQLKDGAIVVGSGTGEVKFDAKPAGCTETGKWSASYSVSGSLDTDPTCRLALRIDVKWTNGYASMQCGGMTVGGAVPDYPFSLTAIFDNNAHEIHTTTEDGGLDWDNKFQMIRFDSTGVTRCQFNS